jgi:diguanylate cyclase (GGDEF)-like protein
MILCFDPKGLIRYVSDALLSALKEARENFVGKNILSFRDVFGIRKQTWLEDLIHDFHSQNLSELVIGDQKRWLLWNFEAQLNTDASIGMIVARGHEISDFTKNTTTVVQDLNHDYLTGLLNRQGLQDQLARLENKISKAAAYFIDCWTFSKIVDYYGHHVSDEVVLLMANEFQKKSNGKCLLCRYSDTQFVLVCLDEEAEEKAVLHMVDRLEKELVSVYSTQDFTFQVDKRIGYALFPDDTTNLSKLVACSSLAMKESIKLDQISVKRYQKHMSETLEQNVLFASKLRTALDSNQIEIHFQKIMNVSDTTVFSLEELARWTDPELGVISPKTLFAIAKEANMIDPLERYLVEKALVAIKQVMRSFPYRNVKLALNITPSSLLDKHFLGFLDEIVYINGLKPSDICIEISESTFINSVETCVRRINEFKEHGYEIAIDDFGKEYSSLAILESVSFDIIKIDALFVDKIHLPKNQEIIKMIARIAKITNSKIIAEGVETSEQRDILLKLGCTIQQGYFFNRPDKVSSFIC